MCCDYFVDDVVVYYDDDYKSLLLSDAVIDQGIRELVDAVNECEYLVTMNSCQGFLIESEKTEHCPRAYVDFFVLEHRYILADTLLLLLAEEFGSRIICKLEYQADFDIVDDPEGETAIDNGLVILRYRIELAELRQDLQLSTYKEIVDYIIDYAYDTKEIA